MNLFFFGIVILIAYISLEGLKCFEYLKNNSMTICKEKIKCNETCLSSSGIATYEDLDSTLREDAVLITKICKD